MTLVLRTTYIQTVRRVRVLMRRMRLGPPRRAHAPALRSLPHLAAAAVSVGVALALAWMPYSLGLMVAALLAMDGVPGAHPRQCPAHRIFDGEVSVSDLGMVRLGRDREVPCAEAGHR